MKITFLRADSFTNTRIQKWIYYLHKKGFDIDYIGWNRLNEDTKDSRINNVEFILNGLGYQNKFVRIFYIIYIVKLFIKLIFKKHTTNNIYFSVDIFSAFPVYLAKLFIGKNLLYIYEIRDEFSKSYKLNFIVKWIFDFIDFRIRNKSILVIHVDNNRIDKRDKNYIIINNSPYDYFEGKYLEPKYTNSYAIIGWLSEIRGLNSIFEFAKKHREIEFLIAGHFINSMYKQKFLSLKNVKYFGFIPQNELFSKIKNCSGIFSIYDPSYEINRLAASNKLYDAMMLGIPIITNNEIDPSIFVKDNNIGFTINYEYDNSWTVLAEFDMKKISEYGNNGRVLYEEKYNFYNQLDSIFYPFIKKYCN